MPFDLEKLKKEQIKLAKKILLKDSFEKITTIAGLDQAYVDKRVISAIVVCDAETLEVIEKKYTLSNLKFPYIAGFLNYRLSPSIIETFNGLENKPDLLIVNGSGILHPRRLGLASHVGLLLDLPTIGITKSPLMGEIKGGKVYVKKKILGKMLAVKKHSKPICISPGHKISMRTAYKIIKASIKGHHKMPKPLVFAHKHANSMRKVLVCKS